MLTGSYTGRGRNARYGCRGDHRQRPVYCFGVEAGRPDDLVARELLKVVHPLAMEAALKAHEMAHEKSAAALRMVELALQDACYEARLAARPYEAVDPETRLVAEELEVRWEDAFSRVKDVETRLSEPAVPTAILPEREPLLALAADPSAVWDAPSTDPALKQRIVRGLIREIVINVDPAMATRWPDAEDGSTYLLTVLGNRGATLTSFG